jgi:alpha-glucosidase/alpha-D-xyloside xylohydrolase
MSRCVKVLVVCALVSNSLAAQYSPPKILPKTVAGRNVELAVRVVSERTLRISVTPVDAMGVTEAVRDEPVLVGREWPRPLLRLRSQLSPPAANAAGWQITAGGDVLTVRSGNTALRFEFAADGSVAFPRGEKPIYGLGQGGPQFDRRGQLYTPRNDHGAYNLAKLGGRLPIPLLVSTEGWALFFHQPLGNIDLTGATGKFVPADTPNALPLDFFVIASDPPGIMREYASLTGFPSLPPIWALGYQQSHRTLRDFDEVMWVAKTLREKRLPCDVLIYLGTGWCPSGWNTGHDSFTFNKTVFNEPDKQIGQLKTLNYKVVLHSTYPPRRLFGSVLDANVSDDENEALRYWERHRPVARLGTDGWWPDAAENLGVEGRLARIRMYWEGPQLDSPNRRPYALHRTGYAGMQRMGGWLWSGDVDSTWETLRNHIPIAINTSLSGIPFWGTDIGGFYPTEEYTAEFWVRWFQFMAFSPLFRSHGRTWYTRLPFGWNTGVLGPDEMEHTKAGRTPIRVEQLRDPTVEPITRRYLELRYRLLPYIYTLAREAHDTGMPMIRSLWLHYPDDPQAVSRDDEYLWGRDLLVAPVVQKGARSRKVYLPPGTWYDFWTNARLAGGSTAERAVDLETIPVYVRAGAIVPLGPVKQYTLERVDARLTLMIYTGSDGAAQVYEDDGVTFDFQKGASTRFECRWDDRARQLTVSLAGGSRLVGVQARKIEVELLPAGTRRTLTFTGRPLSVRF